MDTGCRTIKGHDGPSDMILTWESAKDRIYPCLAPRRWAKVRGWHVIYRRFFDLAVYYNVRTDTTGDDIAYTWVDVTLMHVWGIDMQTLHGQALENAKKDGYTIRDIGEVTGTEPMPFGPYVMTNRHCLYGAAGFLDRTMIAQFAETKGTGIYILPSSVHELILLPATKRDGGRGLDEMVSDINRSVVAPDERLADHAYFYEAVTGNIRIV